MQVLRKIFFYIFTVIYIVSCPLIILYALGFIYKPGTEEGVVETGLIHLVTAPAGATVFMNDSRYTQQTPTDIRNLLPGDYSIKLVLTEYMPWERTLSVEAEKATVLDNILLLPLRWEANTLLSGKFSDIFPVPGTDFFLVKSGSTAGDVFVYNYRGQKGIPLLSPDSPYVDCRPVSYFTVKESPAVLCHFSSQQVDKFFWVEFGENENTVKDVTSLFSVEPRQVEWLPDQTDYVFAFQDGYLNRVDVDSGAVYPEYIRDLRGYGLFNSEVYILRKDNVFSRMDYDKNSQKVMLDDPGLAGPVFGEKGDYRMEFLSGDIILFLGEKGELLSNHLPYRFVDAGVRGVEPFPGLEQVLVFTKDRIGILDFSVEKTGNVDFEKGPGLTWLYKEGNDIRQAFWVYGGSHVLFRDGSGIFLMSAEPEEGYKASNIFKVKDNSSVFYSEQDGKLYFLDRSRPGLHSVVIVPGKGTIQTSLSGQKGQNEQKGSQGI